MGRGDGGQHDLRPSESLGERIGGGDSLPAGARPHLRVAVEALGAKRERRGAADEAEADDGDAGHGNALRGGSRGGGSSASSPATRTAHCGRSSRAPRRNAWRTSP